ncbi:hypothetical protein HPG69_005106 [Diceros bicornis minor]|uniref:Uncharacterized protein n=1 Tax=Diceros bicornis minor TaxID=77932 RepID=A0A7J7EFR1_DICBM|nr:hypothetical protein HPG69_005106 [Diceros bicornis minor]
MDDQHLPKYDQALAAETPGALYPEGGQMSSRTVHIYGRQLEALQWGHQEVPAKFNFANDVVDHWSGVGKC